MRFFLLVVVLLGAFCSVIAPLEALEPIMRTEAGQRKLTEKIKRKWLRSHNEIKELCSNVGGVCVFDFMIGGGKACGKMFGTCIGLQQRANRVRRYDIEDLKYEGLASNYLQDLEAFHQALFEEQEEE